MQHADIHAISYWDWAVIVFYFVFIVGIGFLFKHVNKNSSDYFRGGGNMLWWMAGMSAMMSGLSTWSFTGAAAKVYDTGFLLPVSWVIGVPLILPIGLYMAPRFRQMRVVTSIEGVFRRFGFGTEQFYTYLVLPMGIFWGGVGLNTIAVFMSAALGLPMVGSLITVGIIVTVMSATGGQWAVAASDFVQGLILFLIVIVVVYFCLQLPEIGGLMNLRNSLPERHWDFTWNANPSLIWLWIIFVQIGALMNQINMHGQGAKFLLVKDGRQARGMVWLNTIFGVFIPMVFVIQLPAICAATVYPDMAQVFPNLKIPEEGAWVAMAFKTLPNGLLGVLICGMFAASMSTMDTALNRNAGYFVRNVYIKYLKRGASETNQVLVGRIFTIIFGALMILIGLGFDALRKGNLFDVFQVLNSLVMLPSVIPVALGTVYKRTPGWSGWTTVLVGMGAGAIANKIYSPELFQRIMGYAEPLNAREMPDAQFIFICAVVLVVGCTWFFLTSLFYDKSSKESRERIEKLFLDMNTPVDHVRESIRDQDAMQYRLVGLTCLILGAGLLLGVLIPNPLRGRVAFLFVGGTIFLMGVLLYGISVRKYKNNPEAER